MTPDHTLIPNWVRQTTCTTHYVPAIDSYIQPNSAWMVRALGFAVLEFIRHDYTWGRPGIRSRWRYLRPNPPRSRHQWSDDELAQLLRQRARIEPKLWPRLSDMDVQRAMRDAKVHAHYRDMGDALNARVLGIDWAKPGSDRTVIATFHVPPGTRVTREWAYDRFCAAFNATAKPLPWELVPKDTAKPKRWLTGDWVLKSPDLYEHDADALRYMVTAEGKAMLEGGTPTTLMPLGSRLLNWCIDRIEGALDWLRSQRTPATKDHPRGQA